MFENEVCIDEHWWRHLKINFDIKIYLCRNFVIYVSLSRDFNLRDLNNDKSLIEVVLYVDSYQSTDMCLENKFM